jgi:hypothetical protein
MPAFGDLQALAIAQEAGDDTSPIFVACATGEKVEVKPF